MNEAAPEEDRLFEEALDLVIRLQNDPSNPVSHEMIRRWRARGPDHEVAWAEVAEIHGMAGKVVAEGRRPPAGMTRRNLVIAGLAGGVAAAVGYATVPGLLIDARADYATGTAEIRRIPLSDGSTVTLGPDSAIALRFGKRLRLVELLVGMAFFDVAKDEARPFQVTTSDLAATALGTAFDISNDAGFLSVSVDHGAVDVRVRGSDMAEGGKLDSGQWVTFDERSRSIQRGRRDVSQIAAWRDGQIFAENEPIGSVVAKIARWQPGRVIVADPWFGTSRISGVFDLNDPLRALEAVVHPFGGRVRRVGSYLTVISPV
ncbi:FecR domain-containing protein [Aquabacter sp. CN5-332]|uniref:FecR family protein n=1 Tax=Aquabacter sp. CN5-332 TaxID=3156608 RepID=UPI0032B5A098